MHYGNLAAMIMTSQSRHIDILREPHVSYDEIDNRCIGANDYDCRILNYTSYYLFLQKGRKYAVWDIT